MILIGGGHEDVRETWRPHCLTFVLTMKVLRNNVAGCMFQGSVSVLSCRIGRNFKAATLSLHVFTHRVVRMTDVRVLLPYGTKTGSPNVLLFGLRSYLSTPPNLPYLNTAKASSYRRIRKGNLYERIQQGNHAILR